MTPDTQVLDQAEKQRTLREACLVALALITSTGTLVCCALPIMLVSIAGLGAFVASMASTFPILIELSQHKEWVFGLSGAALAVAAWMVWRPGRSCPTDPLLARWCDTFQVWNRRVVVVSGVIWSIGFSAAFLALPLRVALGV